MNVLEINKMTEEEKHQLTFVFDIDGTLCPLKTKEQKYEDLVPYPEMVDKIREYKKDGAKIVFFTSRNMNTYDSNIGKINVNTGRIIFAWLDKWQIPYDEVVFGKVWAGFNGFYVDDRTVRPDEFLKYNTEELAEICTRSRCKEV